MEQKNNKKESTFDLHWNASNKLKQYDALKDPHANYYFVSKAAKQRLKDLKKEIRKGNKSAERKQMMKLIKEKMKFEFELPKMKLPIIQAYNAQQLLNSKKDRARLGSQSVSNKVVTERAGDPPSNNPNKELKYESTGGLQKFAPAKLKKKKSESNIRHQDFLRFLTEKRTQIVRKSERND